MTSIDEVDFPDGSESAMVGIGSDDVDDAALEAMKARVAEMEAEAAKLREMQEQANNGMGAGDGASSQAAMLTEEEKEEVDARSVYVGNVSNATHAETNAHPLTLLSSSGRLWRDTRGSATAFLLVRHHKSSDDTLRQVHRTSKRVCIC